MMEDSAAACVEAKFAQALEKAKEAVRSNKCRWWNRLVEVEGHGPFEVMC